MDTGRPRFVQPCTAENPGGARQLARVCPREGARVAAGPCVPIEGRRRGSSRSCARRRRMARIFSSRRTMIMSLRPVRRRRARPSPPPRRAVRDARRGLALGVDNDGAGRSSAVTSTARCVGPGARRPHRGERPATRGEWSRSGVDNDDVAVVPRPRAGCLFTFGRAPGAAASPATGGSPAPAAGVGSLVGERSRRVYTAPTVYRKNGTRMVTGFAAVRSTMYTRSGTGRRGLSDCIGRASYRRTRSRWDPSPIVFGGSRQGDGCRRSRARAGACVSVRTAFGGWRRGAVPARGGPPRKVRTTSRRRSAPVVRDRSLSSLSGVENDGLGRVAASPMRPPRTRATSVRPRPKCVSMDPRGHVVAPGSPLEVDRLTVAREAAKCLTRPLCTPKVDVRRGLVRLRAPFGDTTADHRREACADAGLRFSVYVIRARRGRASLLVHRPRSYIETRLYKNSPVSGVQSR